MRARVGKRAKIAIISTVCVIMVLAVILTSVYFGLYSSAGKTYTTTRIDLSIKPNNLPCELEYLYDFTVVDHGDKGETYLAHPDSIMMEDAEGNDALCTFYALGHGKGEIAVKTSLDCGKTYSERLDNLPESWKYSEETPTVFRLDFVDGSVKYILVSACPKWVGYKQGNGFCVSLYSDGVWSEFERFYGEGDNPYLYPIVAMSSLVRLKENGKFVDRWMGFFHDNNFKLYSTVLSFDGGKMCWSKPVEYLQNSYNQKGKSINQTLKAKATKACEVLVVRSEQGNGDVLCMITRSETRLINSLMAFSYDEGKTWSELKELPSELNGQRHKAVYDGDRLFITFRSVERNVKFTTGAPQNHFVSEGCVAWVGTFEDLENWYYNGVCNSQYRIKLAHTYLDGQFEPEYFANDDTGYCGVTIVDGYIVVTSYGKVLKNSDKTVIFSKRLKLADIDKLANIIE